MKVYDPILCMLVEKKTRDEKPMSKMDVNELRRIVKELGGDVNKTYGTSKVAIMLYIDKLKKKTANDSSVDKAIRAIDSEKGYELDGYWIKPLDYGVEVTKNGKKVGEFDTTSEAEKWIRGKYGD